MNFFKKKISNGVDWVLFFSIPPVLLAGLITIKSFGSSEDYFFTRQIIWIIISIFIFFALSFIDWRFLRKSEVLMLFYLLSIVFFVILLVFIKDIRGASSWFKTSFFSIEPSEPFKILMIFILAKYFSRRHIEIARFRHIFISVAYAFVPATLIFLQPDFGSAVIIFLIWLGMIMVSGVKKTHLLIIFLLISIVISSLWLFVFKEYQKDRIKIFLNPYHDIQGAGYNANQSMIAVGSGRLFGKGIGYGTQSRLEFLPEHKTDFVFAAFAEEWGFIGVFIILIFYGIIIWRVLRNAMLGQGNFESFFGLGMAIFLIAHLLINIGMNIGLLPITGTPLTFMSYGGSHMLTVFAGLGVLMGMRRYGRKVHPDDLKSEFLGL